MKVWAMAEKDDYEGIRLGCTEWVYRVVDRPRQRERVELGAMYERTEYTQR